MMKAATLITMIAALLMLTLAVNVAAERGDEPGKLTVTELVTAESVKPVSSERNVATLKPQAATASKLEVLPSGDDGDVIFDSSAKKSPEALCSGEWMGPSVYFVDDWYTGGEYYAAYQDPIEDGCAETYPFGITDIHWELYNQTASTVYLNNFQMLIWDVDHSVPGCPRPGNVLWISGSYSLPISATSSFDISAALSSEQCVSGPYFVGFYCPENIGIGIIAPVFDDPTPDPARTCAVWNDWGTGWQDITNYIPAYNMRLWSEGQSSTSNSCDCGLNPGLWIDAAYPTENQNDIPVNIPRLLAITAQYPKPNFNISNWKVSSDVSGQLTGSIEDYSMGSTGFKPDQDFLAGDVITSTITNDLACESGFLKNGFTWQFTTRTQPSAGTFIPDGNYTNPKGLPPGRTVCADFNNDGYIDLASSQAKLWEQDSVMIWLNNGSGQYPNCSYYIAGIGISGLYAADLDGDGDMDLATVGNNYLEHTLIILFNNGDGDFITNQVYPYSGDPNYYINGGDLDNDGDIDLVLSGGDEKLLVWRNNSDGTFGTTVDVSLGGGEIAAAVDIADIDNDGHLDLVVSIVENSSAIRILKNNGDGTFANMIYYSLSLDYFTVVTSDMDGDGKLDLLYGRSNQGVSIVWQNSDGTFTQETAYTGPTPPVMGKICTGDLDGDGHLDFGVLTRNFSSGNSGISIFINSGQYPFRSFAFAGFYLVDDQQRDLSFADVDQDGDLDLAITNFGFYDISILLNESLTCCINDRGNANNDPGDLANIADITFLVDYLFGIPSGPAPVCIEEANANSDPGELANIADITFLVDYLFGIPSGPAPGACP